MKQASSKGFGLLELVVSLPIAVLVLLLVTQLLQDVQRTYATTRHSVVAPLPHHTLQLLRNDLQGTKQILSSSTTLPGRPLNLVLGDNSRIRYEKLNGAFFRVQLSPSTGPENTLLLLDKVMNWTWGEIQPGLVEVKIDYLRNPLAPITRSGLPLFKMRKAVPEPLRLRVALRGLPGKDSW